MTTWPRDCCRQHRGIRYLPGDGAEAAERLLAWVGSGTSEPGLQERCVENLVSAGWKDKAEGQVEPDSESLQWLSDVVIAHSGVLLCCSQCTLFFQMNSYVLSLYE